MNAVRLMLRHTLPSLLLGALLSLPLSAQAAATAEPAPQPHDPRVDQLIGELLNNVDWRLLLRLQQNILANMELLVPYTQEYVNCLEAEGTLDRNQPLTLKQLIGAAKNASATCNVILQSLASQLDFDLTEEELNEGLSPEYRELLKKSL